MHVYSVYSVNPCAVNLVCHRYGNMLGEAGIIQHRTTPGDKLNQRKDAQRQFCAIVKKRYNNLLCNIYSFKTRIFVLSFWSVHYS